MPKGKKKVSAEQFIVAWNKAASPEQAAKTLGISAEFAKAKAAWYRKRDVKNLKVFPSTRGAARLDVAKLSALAASSLRGKSSAKNGKHASA